MVSHSCPFTNPDAIVLTCGAVIATEILATLTIMRHLAAEKY